MNFGLGSSKNPSRFLRSVLLLFPFLFLLGSCLGVNADITLNQNGSGIITLEYRISKALDSLGKLDGNERWNTIPVGKADFERTMDRLPDMKLLAFSSKEDEKDLIFTAKMEFASIRGLLAFIDAAGESSSFSGNEQSGRLALALNKGRGNKNSSLDALLAAVAKGYYVTMSMTFPGEGTCTLTDSNGKPLGPADASGSKGKKASFSLPLYDVLSAPAGINAEFSW